MLDERIIQDHEFMKHDEFMNSKDLKSLLFKIKHNEIILQLQRGDSQEKVVELVQKLQEYDPNNETLTMVESKKLV